MATVGEVITFFEGRAEQLFETIEEIERRLIALSKKDFSFKVDIDAGEDNIQSKVKTINQSVAKGLSVDETVKQIQQEVIKTTDAIEKKVTSIVDNIDARVNTAIDNLTSTFSDFQQQVTTNVEVTTQSVANLAEKFEVFAGTREDLFVGVVTSLEKTASLLEQNKTILDKIEFEVLDKRIQSSLNNIQKNVSSESQQLVQSLNNLIARVERTLQTVSATFAQFERREVQLFRKINASLNQLQERLINLAKTPFKVTLDIEELSRRTNFIERAIDRNFTNVIKQLKQVEKQLKSLNSVIGAFDKRASVIGKRVTGSLIGISSLIGLSLLPFIIATTKSTQQLAFSFSGLFAFVSQGIKQTEFSFAALFSFLGSSVSNIFSTVVNMGSFIVTSISSFFSGNALGLILQTVGVVGVSLQQSLAVLGPIGNIILNIGVAVSSIGLTVLGLPAILTGIGFILGSYVKSIKTIFGFTEAGKTPLQKIVDLINVVFEGLSRIQFTTARIFLTASTFFGFLATAFFSPLNSLLFIIPTISSLATATFETIRVTILKIRAGLGDGRARITLLITDIREFLIFAIKNTTTINNNLRNAAKLFPKLRLDRTGAVSEIPFLSKLPKTLGVLKQSNEEVFKLQESLRTAQFPIGVQFQRFRIEVTTFLSNLTQQINTLLITVQTVFGLSKDEIDIIQKESKEITDSIQRNTRLATSAFDTLAVKRNGFFGKTASLFRKTVITPILSLEKVFDTVLAKPLILAGGLLKKLGGGFVNLFRGRKKEPILGDQERTVQDIAKLRAASLGTVANISTETKVVIETIKAGVSQILTEVRVLNNQLETTVQTAKQAGTALTKIAGGGTAKSAAPVSRFPALAAVQAQPIQQQLKQLDPEKIISPFRKAVKEIQAEIFKIDLRTPIKEEIEKIRTLAKEESKKITDDAVGRFKGSLLQKGLNAVQEFSRKAIDIAKTTVTEVTAIIGTFAAASIIGPLNVVLNLINSAGTAVIKTVAFVAAASIAFIGNLVAQSLKVINLPEEVQRGLRETKTLFETVINESIGTLQNFTSKAREQFVFIKEAGVSQFVELTNFIRERLTFATAGKGKRKLAIADDIKNAVITIDSSFKKVTTSIDTTTTNIQNEVKETNELIKTTVTNTSSLVNKQINATREQFKLLFQQGLDVEKLAKLPMGVGGKTVGGKFGVPKDISAISKLVELVGKLEKSDFGADDAQKLKDKLEQTLVAFNKLAQKAEAGDVFKDLIQRLNTIKKFEITGIKKAAAEFKTFSQEFNKAFAPGGGGFQKALRESIKAEDLNKLREALTKVAEFMSSFFPSNPPAKQGPLKNLQKQGAEVVNQLGLGLDNNSKKIKGPLNKFTKIISRFFPSSAAKDGQLRNLEKQGTQITKEVGKGVDKSAGEGRKIGGRIAEAIAQGIEGGKRRIDKASRTLSFFITGSFKRFLSDPIQNISESIKDFGESFLISERLGISTEALSGLDFAAKQVGASVEELSFNFRSLKDNLVKSLGDDTVRKTFTDLGLDVRSILSSNDPVLNAFKKLSTRIKTLGVDSKESLKILETLSAFGESRIINLLLLGGKGIETLQQQAVKLGLITTKELTKVAREVIVLRQNFDAVVQILFTKIALGVLPELEKGSKAVLAFVQDNLPEINAVLKITVQLIVRIIQAIKTLFTFIATSPGEFIGDFGKALLNVGLLLTTVFIGFIELASLKLGTAFKETMIDALNTIAKKALELGQQFIAFIAGAIVSAFQSILPQEAFKKLFGKIADPKRAAKTVQGILRGLTKDIKLTVDNETKARREGFEKERQQRLKNAQIRLKDLRQRKNNELKEIREIFKVQEDLEFKLLELRLEQPGEKKSVFQKELDALAIQDVEQDLQSVRGIIKDIQKETGNELEKIQKGIQDMEIAVINIKEEKFNFIDPQQQKVFNEFSERFKEFSGNIESTKTSKALKKLGDDLAQILSFENFKKETKKAAKETKDNLNDIAKETEKNQRNLTKTAREQAKVFIETYNKASEEVAKNFAKISTEDIPKFLQSIVAPPEGLIKKPFEEARKEVRKLEVEILRLEKEFLDFARDFKEVPEEVARLNSAASRRIVELNQQLKQLRFKQFLDQNKEAFKLIETTAENAKRPIQKLNEEFEKQIELLEKSREAAKKILPTEQFEKFNEELNKTVDQLDTNLVKKVNENVISTLTDGFGTVLNNFVEKGEVSFENLAEVGKNIMTGSFNQIADFMKEKFSDTLTKVFKALGVTSEIGSLAVAGITAIAGLLLSRLTEQVNTVNKSIEETVEKTEQVRGVIAGETTIGVQEIADRLVNVNRPIVSELEEIKDVLIDIRDIVGGNSNLGINNNF